MKEASTNILENKSLYSCFKSLITLPGIGEEAISRCHFNIVKKTLNARAGVVFKLFHDKFIGHYSKMVNMAFRTTLQASAKSTKQKDLIKTKQKVYQHT